MADINWIDIFATVCFVLAILHTFSVKRFQHIAHGYQRGSVGENLFHLLSEVEVVFGLWAAVFLTGFFARLLPLKRPMAFYATCLTVGPLLGSFITEPAAMTVTAFILLERFYKKGISTKFMYATLGLLFLLIFHS